MISVAIALTCRAVAVGPNAEQFTFVAVGDLMFNNLRLQGAAYPFSSVADVLKKADIAFANLETPLTARGTRTPFKSAADLRARRQYILRGDTDFARPIAASGIDIVSFANNHAMDYGEVGMRDTHRLLDRIGVKHVGAGGTRAAACRHATLKVGNIRIAFLAYLCFRGGGNQACAPAGERRPGIAVIPHDGGSGISKAGVERLRFDIARARANADLVFVSFHWGNERKSLPSPYQQALGRKAVELGANLVIGHHPHVLQPIERYRGVPIIYSLGNFVAPNYAGPLGETGIVRTTWRGRVLERLEFLPARIVGGAPRLLTGNSAAAASRHFAQLGQRLKASQPR